MNQYFLGQDNLLREFLTNSAEASTSEETNEEVQMKMKKLNGYQYFMHEKYVS